MTNCHVSHITLVSVNVLIYQQKHIKKERQGGGLSESVRRKFHPAAAARDNLSLTNCHVSRITLVNVNLFQCDPWGKVSKVGVCV